MSYSKKILNNLEKLNIAYPENEIVQLNDEYRRVSCDS